MTLTEAVALLHDASPMRKLWAMLRGFRKILLFPQERANRAIRFVQICRAYANGEAVREIEARFGCSRGTVLRYARMSGQAKRPKHFPHEIKAAVLRDYHAGLSIAEIAAAHNVSQAYVSKAAGEAGIQRYRSKR